jgi:CRP-like cAMP-binding protein
MALDDDIRILSDVGLFEGLSREQLRILAFGAETLRVAPGRELYHEGSPADCAFVVVSGRIAIFRDREGERVPLGVAVPHDLLGQYALITDIRRMTSAAAEVESAVMRLNRKLFRRILEEYPEAAYQLHQRIATDLQSMIAEIERLKPRFA